MSNLETPTNSRAVRRPNLSAAFQRLVTSTASVAGLDFFRALVQELASSLGLKFALVSELTDLRLERARTLSLWAGGAQAENFEYDLNGTPCEMVAQGELCFFGSAVCARFPDDAYLIEMGAEAYVGAPLRDSQGHAIGILAALHDEPLHESDELRELFQVFALRAGIELERLRMQRALVASEKRFRGLLESGTDLILAVDRDGRIQYASPSCLRVAGYTSEETLGRLAFDFIHMDDRAAMLNLLCTAIQRPTPGPLYETRIQHKNGHWIDVEFRANQIFLDPHSPGLVINCRDISERKKSEAHLRFQKTLLETQSECSLEGVIVVSREGKVLHTNRRFANVWKLDSDAAVSERCGEIWKRILPKLAAPSRVAPVVDELADDPDQTLQDTWQLEDGRTIECYSAPVRHQSGACFGRLWSCRDVTEQVRLEEQVRHSQRLDCIGVVSAGIAHEFKNILGPILGNAELASLDIPAGHPAHKWLGQIIRSTQSARDLVQQILTFSRQAPTASTVVSLSEIVTDAVRMLRVAIPKTVEISRSIASNLPPVKVDSNQIHQVIMNLGINAWQAMPQSRGQISVALEFASGIDLSALGLPAGDYIRMAVSDDGKGMDSETLSRLFEPFFTTKPPGEGTGLGLPVVHGIVKSHGGAIRVASSPGAGATFEIFLPPAERGESAN